LYVVFLSVALCIHVAEVATVVVDIMVGAAMAVVGIMAEITGGMVIMVVDMDVVAMDTAAVTVMAVAGVGVQA
jgi:hypothetical protein